MSVPALIALPDTCAASLVMSMTRVVEETTSPFTLEDQAFKWPGERWSISFAPPVLTSREIAAPWLAFGLAMEGKFNRFLYGDPLGKVPRGVATGTPLVDGGAATGNTLPTKGWTHSITGILKKGDYIQLGTGLSARLHMLIADANSDGAGKAVLNIVPALKSSPADNAAVIVQNARGCFKMTSNQFSWSVAPGPVYRVSFEAVHA